MPIFVKQNNSWKEVINPRVRVSNKWRECEQVWVYVNKVWRKVLLPRVIEYTAKSYGGQYDGKPHSASVEVKTPGCTIRYGTSPNSYNLTTMPSFTEAGAYTIYFQITKTNYETVTGSVNVILRKASAMTIYELGNAFDVRSGDIKTTYANKGYYIRIKVDGNQTNFSGVSYTPITGLTFTRKAYSNEAGQIVFEFQVVNNSGSTHTIGISVDTDVQIGNNDSAPIYATSTGFYMTDNTNYFDFYLQNYADVTNVDGWYFCHYGSRTNYSWTTEKLQGSLINTDSGMVFNWQNRSITNGRTLVFKVILDMR